MTLFQLLAFSVAVQASSTLNIRQTAAICDPSFTWAQNAEHQSPCIVAGYLNGACGTNSFTVLNLTQGSHYDPPSPSGTANLCSCSWAYYNLLSACTACQGLPDSILTWAAWTAGCTGFTSDSYFPSITLTNATSIPFWATENPLSWTDAQFNVNQAQDLADEGKPDAMPSSSKKSKKTPVGPIVGGVVGGIAALALAAVVVAFFIRKKRARQQQQQQQQYEEPLPVPSFAGGFSSMPTIHDLSMTGTSYKSPDASVDYGRSRLVASPSIRTTYPSPSTEHAHSGSIHSVPFFGSTEGSGSYLPSLSSPPVIQMMNREDAIDPFVTGSSPSPSRGNASRPNFDTLSARPIVVRPEDIAFGGASQETRLSPPAYTPSPDRGSLSGREKGFGHRSPGGEKGSLDSRDSSRNAGENVTPLDGVIGRISLDQTAGRMGNNAVTGPSGGATPAAQPPLNVANPGASTQEQHTPQVDDGEDLYE